MPVKRRLAKKRQFEVTPALRVKYLRAAELHEIYRACDHKTSPCRWLGPNRRCLPCREFFDLSDEIDTELGIRPWQVLPMDCSSVEEALAELFDALDGGRERG